MRPRDREAGLTLVELMVSLTLVSLLVAMTFAMTVQLSAAFRSQRAIADLQQALVATESVLVRDVRQAGFRMPNGYRVAYDADVHQALEITDSSTGPDRIAVAYADAGAQAVVRGFAADRRSITVDDADHFADGDLAVISDARPPPAGVSPVPPQAYDACVVRIVAIAGTTFTLDRDAPWGAMGNPQCSAVAASNAGPSPDTMIYRLVLRAYRIDPARPDLGVLQRSPSGGLDDDWEDLGVGYTDLQVATRWVDATGTRTWQSSGAQDALTAPAAVEPTAFPLAATISVVVRTTQSISGVVSDQTPSLTVAGNVDHNEVGDRPAVLLSGVPDSARPDTLRGDRVYRWSTFRVDLRNLGVGR